MTLLNHRHLGNGVSTRQNDRRLESLHGKVLAPRTPGPFGGARDLKINPNWPKAHLYGIRWHGTQFNMLPRAFVQTKGVIVANLGAGMVSVYRGNDGWTDVKVADFKAARFSGVPANRG